MQDSIIIFMMLIVVFISTAVNLDSSIEKADLAQSVCIKANSKAVSFDMYEVTCENNAVIPLKAD